MALRGEVRRLIKVLEDFLAERYGHGRVLEILSQENKRLRDDNRELRAQVNKLFDRLMARNFETYATYTEDDRFNPSIGSFNEPVEMGGIPGEVIEDETTR